MMKSNKFVLNMQYVQKMLLCMLCVSFCMMANATLRFIPAEGDWNVAENWYDDANNNERRLPRPGDLCFISQGTICTIPDGVVVTNLSIYIGRRNDGVAKLIVKPGSVISNCSVEVAQVAGNVTATGRYAELQIDGGTIDNIKLFVQQYGKIVQNGGYFRATNNLSLVKNSMYLFNGGTNNSSKVYVSSGIPTNQTPLVASQESVFGEKTTHFILNGGKTVLNGTKFLYEKTDLTVPQNSYDNSWLELINFTNTIKDLAIASGGNQTRQDYTGRVDIVDSDIKITGSMLLADYRPRSYALLNVEDSNIWIPEGYAVSHTADDTTLIRDVNIRGDSLLTFGAKTWYGVDEDSSFFSQPSKNIYVTSGTTWSIYGGLVRTTDRLFLGPNSKLNIYGGELRCNRIFSQVGLNSGKEYGKPCTVNICGGLLKTYKSNYGGVYIGGDGNSTVASPSEITVNLSDGVYDTAEVSLGNRSTNQVQRFVFCGGHTSSRVLFRLEATNVVAMIQKGSASSPAFKGFNIFSPDFNLGFIMDKSPEHIAPFVLLHDGGYAKRGGNLRVGLDGGVMISGKTSFDLMTITNSIQSTFLKYPNSNGELAVDVNSDFLSVPDTTLWMTNLSADAKTVSVSLADALGSSQWKNGTVDLSSAPAPMGSIQLSNIITNNCLEWEVRMNLKAADGGTIAEEKLEEIVDGFIAAGYTNSCAIAEEGANVKLVVAREDMPTGNARFVWDLTDSSSVRRPDTVITNALVSAISFRNVPIITGLMILVK